MWRVFSVRYAQNPYITQIHFFFKRLVLLRIGTSGDCYGHCNETAVLKNVATFLTSWGTISFSRRTLLHGIS